MAIDFLSRFVNYSQTGAMHAVGVEPVGLGRLSGPLMAGQRGAGSLGTEIFTFAGGRFTLGHTSASFGKMARTGLAGAIGAGALSYMNDGDVGGAVVTGGFMGAMLAGKPKMLAAEKTGGPRSWSRFLGPGLNTAMSGYFVYQGYKENGMSGARDALVWDVAVNSAVAKFGYKAVHPEAAIGATRASIISKGFAGNAVRMLGAGVGAQIGQAIGDSIGIPGGSIAGAFAGAYVGAAPMRFIASHPIIAAGAVVAGGMAATGYGAYEVMKMGYAQKQSRRGIQTSGDLAAFMTAGANTMRGRAVQAIQKSHLNARSALGQEANFLHYPSRNYHSPYRT